MNQINAFHIDGREIYASDIYIAARKGSDLQIAHHVMDRIASNRAYLEKKMEDPATIIYGINTGFGSLCNIRISDEHLQELQENLIASHACGMGDLVPYDISRGILLLKIVNLSHGSSGIRPVLLSQLCQYFTQSVIPVLYQLGSLGASGDLAPLAHLSLPLLGKGHVWSEGRIEKSEEILPARGFSPLRLESKEGLALLNGTQFSLGYACFIATEGMALIHLANQLAALSMDAFICDTAPLNALIHQARPHKGQLAVAESIRALLAGSALQNKKKTSVQDPYSFRCVPQVHGASLMALEHAMDVINTEIGSVTDNPLVFDEADLVVSGGNFHAQPLALVLDYISIALAELGNISERRIYQLINGDRGLPAYLTKDAGLNSGMMIVQYTAASIVSQNKQYCTPASVDSIVSSKGQEDHVSMASNAATKGFKVLENVKRILALEWLVAAQALEFRRPSRTSDPLEHMVRRLRDTIPPLEKDRVLHSDMQEATRLVQLWLEESIGL